MEGFQVCLKRRSDFFTRARKSFVFKSKIKYLHEHLYKIIGFERKIEDANDNLKKIIDVQRKIKDLHGHLLKIIGFYNVNQRFQQQSMQIICFSKEN